ncbi:MAG: anthranilate phosphoribosyltransferase, partial [Alphaproteobacteria bacterium]
LSLHAADAIKGGDAATNAQALRTMLSGVKGAYRDAVLLNAAATLLAAEKTPDLRAGVARAAEAIDSGKALHTLDALIKVSHE